MDSCPLFDVFSVPRRPRRGWRLLFCAAALIAMFLIGQKADTVQAQRDGNWALYGEEIRKLGELLDQLGRRPD